MSATLYSYLYILRSLLQFLAFLIKLQFLAFLIKCSRCNLFYNKCDIQFIEIFKASSISIRKFNVECTCFPTKFQSKWKLRVKGNIIKAMVKCCERKLEEFVENYYMRGNYKLQYWLFLRLINKLAPELFWKNKLEKSRNHLCFISQEFLTIYYTINENKCFWVRLCWSSVLCLFF